MGEDGLKDGNLMGKKGKRWTEKQIKEKIQELKVEIRRKRNRIKEIEEELFDLELLKKAYQSKLKKKYENPSSKYFGKK